MILRLTTADENDAQILASNLHTAQSFAGQTIFVSWPSRS